LGRRSFSGLTRIRSKRGESNFMTEHYALLQVTPSRLVRSAISASNH
jgi:hypothetical protein